MIDVTVYRRFCQVIWLQFTSSSLVQCIKLCTSLVYKWVLLSKMGCAAFSIPAIFPGKVVGGKKTFENFFPWLSYRDS